MSGPTRAALLALGERCECRPAGDQIALLDEAVSTVWPSSMRSRERDDYWRGLRLLSLGAYLDVARLLVPPRHVWTLHGEDDGGGIAGVEPAVGDGSGCSVAQCHGATEALALAAAALRARAAEAPA